ncbi:MAG: PadR family transcriptional regulator [Nocardioides sp.]|nr:PadR family transcriptional regulator [Nocardioides sp.]
MPDTPGTAVLRRFNRTWSQRVGVLEDSFLGLGLPLSRARLLHEVGHDPDVTVRDLRERLDLDSGYLSRLLRDLEDRKLVVLTPDPADRRRRRIHLTRSGARLAARLEDRSEDLAQRLVDPLTVRQRERLLAALGSADLLVRAATVHLERVAPDGPLAAEAMASYVAELDATFPDGFAPGPVAPPEVVVLARSDGATAACGGLQPLGDGTAEVKRMWVSPDWRGAGLGARLLRHLEGLAREAGHERVVLDTNLALTDAVALYERNGYRRTERYNDNPYAEAFFTKDLTQDLTQDLTSPPA